MHGAGGGAVDDRMPGGRAGGDHDQAGRWRWPWGDPDSSSLANGATTLIG